MMIVDASVVVKWFVDEDRADEARSLLGLGEQLSAPRYIILEIAHVLWKLHRKREIVDNKRDRAMAVMQSVFGNGADTDSLTSRAVKLMNDLSLPVYDCLYLALAEREGVPLATADERQYAAARKARIGARLL